MGHDGGRQGATSREADWDADALQEWVAHVADAEEVSEGEILDRMLSALWILDEVESLMEESDGSGIPDLDLDGVVQDAGPDTDAASDSTPRGWGDREVPDLDPAALLAAVDAIRGDAGSGSREENAPGMARLDARLDGVVDDLAALTTRVDRLHDTARPPTTDTPPTAQNTTATEPLEHVPDLAATVDDLEAQVDANAASLDEHDSVLEELEETLDEQAEALDEHTEALDEQAETLEEHDTTLDDHDDVLETHDERQAAYDSNFENVDTALRFLVDRTDDVSDTVEQLQASLAAERRERRRRADERRRLAELRHELASYGVTRASCESCRNDVDVSCLLRPRCPHCDRVFDGHRRRGGIMGFLATDELTTTRSGPRMQTPDSRDPEPPTSIDDHPADD